ncbi:MAG: hypothetical protein OEY12_14405, partial [Nitrospira sp.]|nr:hypothetical protein [Nitrospira sp.]
SHAQVADHSQCDGASWNFLAIRSGAGGLTFKTVARLFARCGLAGRAFLSILRDALVSSRISMPVATPELR